MHQKIEETLYDNYIDVILTVTLGFTSVGTMSTIINTLRC